MIGKDKDGKLIYVSTPEEIKRHNAYGIRWRECDLSIEEALDQDECLYCFLDNVCPKLRDYVAKEKKMGKLRKEFLEEIEWKHNYYKKLLPLEEDGYFDPQTWEDTKWVITVYKTILDEMKRGNFRFIFHKEDLGHYYEIIELQEDTTDGGVLITNCRHKVDDNPWTYPGVERAAEIIHNLILDGYTLL